MNTLGYIFLAIYWIGIIIWSLRNKKKAKKELLQIKNNLKLGIVVLLLVLFPFLAMVLTTFFL
jgi:membrane protein YqaA with SNARE-associated domain